MRKVWSQAANPTRVAAQLLVVWLSGYSVASCQAAPPSPRAFDRGDRPWTEPADNAAPNYSTSEVTAIADNLLLFQNPDGGWTKNTNMTARLTESQAAEVMASQDSRASTIDNGATHSQLKYLAAAYTQTGDRRYRQAFAKGIEYLLAAQYDNGGWPQFYPNPRGYKAHITFNDNAMVGVLQLLQDMVQDAPNYAFVDRQLRQQCQAAYDRGIECILKCQIETGGRKTVWCQQHDHKTLAPADARVFEKASLCSGESAAIVQLLMNHREPSPQVIEAIESAVAWLREASLHGIRLERVEAETVRFHYHTSKYELRVVADESAPVQWARFYELETNRPLFCGRDGVVRYSLAEIDRERRTGYAWYVTSPASALKEYDKWKTRQSEQ